VHGEDEATDGRAPDAGEGTDPATDAGAPRAEDPAADDAPPPRPDEAGPRRRAARVAEAARRAARRARELNEHEAVLDAVTRLRRRLPGDDRFGDALSTADGARDPTLTRRIARLAGQRSGGAAHEVGMGALQLWQAAAERSNRGRGDVDLTVLFTDLVGFSQWALQAGDEATLLLLREVAGALEPAVRAHRGTVVKWLGDGMMAVFREPGDALRAVEEGREALRGIEIAGYQPRIRAGMHLGRPRRVGADYLGVDVNIAARVANAAGTDELLVSEPALAALDPGAVVAKRRRRLRAKGVPDELGVHAVRSR
jgi:adenylate cyclase